ncbi:hypothetical protein BSKO_08824 [Bryopsis sp. KO-2023]|nr:hypothetical protein BSKO_08824 [Bryopsis sp. KO-2023]
MRQRELLSKASASFLSCSGHQSKINQLVSTAVAIDNILKKMMTLGCIWGKAIWTLNWTSDKKSFTRKRKKEIPSLSKMHSILSSWLMDSSHSWTRCLPMRVQKCPKAETAIDSDDDSVDSEEFNQAYSVACPERGICKAWAACRSQRTLHLHLEPSSLHRSIRTHRAHFNLKVSEELLSSPREGLEEIPTPRLGSPIQQGDGGFGGAMHGNQTGFNGSPQPHSGFEAVQTSGFYPQGGQGYSGIQPGMVNQPKSGLQGGLQSSGNPFA